MAMNNRKSQLSPQQLYALQLMHEEFAQRASTILANLLPADPKLRVEQLEQLRLTEYLFSCSHPTCMHILEPLGLGGKWLLDFAPELAYRLVNLLLGGESEQDLTPERPLSDIEWKVLERVSDSFVIELGRIWSEFGVKEVGLASSLTNPQLAQIAGATDAMIAIRMEFSLRDGAPSGTLTLAFPQATIASACQAILSKYLNSEDSSAGTPTQVKMAETEVRVNLAKSSISASDLMNLQVGDIVTTEQPAGADLEVDIQGVGKLRGRAGSLRGKKAIEITQALDD